MFNVWSNSAPVPNIKFRNLGDLDFDLSRPLKVKCDGVIGLLVYDLLLIFDSNMWHKLAPYESMSDLEFDFKVMQGKI